ncbi:glycosyltransferase [Arachnia propionica]|uniref:Glycosyltransferase n=1 Tax=Arachnia propionica TaxID=1750 RepID=A0AB37HVJ5_9ACTN|nr:glycosyltransferase [Arachnia propionica]AFN45513.1 glycosyltransferase, group 2 family protein [Arachnia propionica F0230a]QCT39050.1 glycosyltransferase [Arachnia propionica]QUC11320.1 glycosyltransferase [Arachnia propionica]RPA18171.1 glycosyltransferase [Arachnia propionica]
MSEDPSGSPAGDNTQAPESVTVVVCAYTLDRWTDLHDGVLEAARQLRESGREGRVLVVVDHNDELLAKAGELAGPLVDVIANTHRRGLSGGRNTAIGFADTEVIVFLDDDATPEPGWLEHLLVPFADREVLVAGGAATPRWPDGAARPVSLPAAPSGRGELDWVVGCTYEGQPTTLAPVRNVMGCNMAFRATVFDTAGLFGEDLGRVGRVPYGCEETELCIRVTRHHPTAGILFEPRSRVRHHVSPDRLRWNYLWRRTYAEGISKAAVTERTSHQASLSTEMSYATRILPRGFLRELLSAPRTRGRGLGGAFAIASALAMTGIGYVVGHIAIRWRRSKQSRREQKGNPR